MKTQTSAQEGRKSVRSSCCLRCRPAYECLLSLCVIRVFVASSWPWSFGLTTCLVSFSWSGHCLVFLVLSCRCLAWSRLVLPCLVALSGLVVCCCVVLVLLCRLGFSCLVSSCLVALYFLFYSYLTHLRWVLFKGYFMDCSFVGYDLFLVWWRGKLFLAFWWWVWW